MLLVWQFVLQKEILQHNETVYIIKGDTIQTIKTPGGCIFGRWVSCHIAACIYGHMCWWSLISICARSWCNIQYFLFTISDCGFPVTHTNNHEQMETQRNDNHCVDETRWWNPAMTITARSRSEPDLIRCPCAMRLVHWISLHKTGQCYATKLASVMLSRMASRPNQHMSSCWHLPINLSPLLLLAWLVPFWQAASPSGFPGVASVQLRIVHEGMLSCKTRRATTAYFLVSRFCFPAWAAEMTLYVFLSCFLADLAELQTQQQNTPKHSACLMLCFRPPKKIAH
jgi:hypothetical protein